MTSGPPPWLVTGASGFLGRHLLQTIQNDSTPRRAIALVRDLAAWRDMEWTAALDRVTPLAGELLPQSRPDPVWWTDPGLDGLTGIFHLAALVRHSRHDTEEVYRTNVEGTLAMVRLAAARRCRLIFVSTSGTVGCFRRPGPAPDEDAPHCADEVARWPYYDSKVRAEREARRLAEELAVDLVIARPPVLLGPGDHRFRSTAILIRFLRGRLPFVVRGGIHFADVRDVALALLRAMALARARPVYHLPGTVCSIEEFFRMAAAAAGTRPPRLVMPFRLAWWLAVLGKPFGFLPDPSLVEMASRHWAMQSRYAQAELGYRSRPGQETLADTVAWLRARAPAWASAAGPSGARPS